MRGVLIRLGFTLDYFQSVLNPKNTLKFLFMDELFIQILFRNPPYFANFWPFSVQKTKKFRPDRIGAGIDPLTRISTSKFYFGL